MNNWQQYIPTAHMLPWLFAGIIVLWKITPFLNAMREASSEPETADGKRGKVSRKRIIPLMFSGIICYMIVSGKTFNEVAFWGLLCYIALDTSIITVTQADGFLDKISALKSNAIKREAESKNKPEEVAGEAIT